MFNWKVLENASQLDSILLESEQKPVLLFKHSTRCNISSVAKNRLETKWKFSENEIDAYYLDLLNHRDISNEIAERFSVHHESPQIILLSKGDVVLDASHLDINVDEIGEQLNLIK